MKNRKTNNNRIKMLRMLLTLLLAFTLAMGMSASVFAEIDAAASANTDAETVSVQQGSASGETAGDAAEADTNAAGTSAANEDASGTSADSGEESANVSGGSNEPGDASETAGEGSGEAAETADGAESESADSESAEQGEEDAEEEQSEEDAENAEDEEESEEAPDTEAESGDFKVSYSSKKYETAPYSFDEATGVLYITGDVTVTMAEGVSSTSQRIVVSENAKVTLDGITIEAKDGPAVKIDQGIKATLSLNGNNSVTGAWGYAAIEVGWEPGNLAELTVDGGGSVKAIGGDSSAGIGGSYNNKTSAGVTISSYCGNIIINDGTIDATGVNGGAAIGSASNNGRNADGSGQSKSFKMITAVGGDEPEIGSITVNGGNITAFAAVGAGIGGGNHVDSGKITINGGIIESARSNDGAGIGSGRGSSNYGGDAAKGHGYFYADIVINGGVIKEAIGGWLSAGIGGGYECDAIINISGGKIEKATGGNGNNGSYYQGAPGIGAGYQGNVLFTMTGGTIEYTKGGWSAPGVGYGAGIQGYGSKRKDFGEHVSSTQSLITITGGTIVLAEGGMYGSGIGGGNGCPECHIVITGGNITAKGYASDENEKMGGAGIGSGVGAGSTLKYKSDTDLDISITGGTVVAVGGWGASGIGSGAQNKTANNITIDANHANIEAYADGTKFAIDTRDVREDHTDSITEGRTINGNILQGTFVHNYTSEDGVDQGTEGIEQIQVISDVDDSDRTVLTGMKDYGLSGYRSFAANVGSAGNYNVYTEVAAVANGEPRYYNKCLDDTRTAEDVETNQDVVERGVKYNVTGNSLSDNFYLFPVKSVIVTKTVIVNGDKKGLTGDVYFALKRFSIDSEGNKVSSKEFEQRDGRQWIESVHIEDGVATGRAAFINVDEAGYDVWEVTQDGTPIKVTEMEIMLGDAKLVNIETKHGEGSDNNAIISKDRWMDYVEVINTYEQPEKPEEPEEPEVTDESVKIRLSKAIGNYFDANGETGAKTANATFVFKVEAFGTDTSNSLYENYVSITFDAYGSAKTEELDLSGVTGIAIVRVTEVYGAGYEAQADEAGNTTVQTIAVAGDNAAEKTEDGYFVFSFTNKYDTTKIVEGSGVLNRYQNKAYTGSAASGEAAA